MPKHPLLLLLVVGILSAANAGRLIAREAELKTSTLGYDSVEGPLYDRKGSLYFTDIPNEKIRKLDIKTLKTRLFRDQTGGANRLAFDSQGRLHTCKQQEKTLARQDLTHSSSWSAGESTKAIPRCLRSILYVEATSEPEKPAFSGLDEATLVPQMFPHSLC